MAHDLGKNTNPAEIVIHDVAFGGAGVGKLDQQVVFVPFTIDGETAKIQITERQRKFLRGKLIKVLQPSTHRVTAHCPLFTECGGCDYQHISYEHQLQIKRLQVQSLLHRVSKLENTTEVLPTIPSPIEYGFRNRITVHSDGTNIGFYKKGSRSIVDVESCPLATPSVNLKLKQLRQKGLQAGNHLTLRENDEVRTFSQTNNNVAECVKQIIEPHLMGPVLIDAYCGSGYFSHAFAAQFNQVIGIEWNSLALKTARENASPNESYIEADVKSVLKNLLQEHHPETLILDPSATGLEPEVIEQIHTAPPKKVLYLSCDPSTFARDIAHLKKCYNIQLVQPFDMFPQTAAIEVLGVLNRR